MLLLKRKVGQSVLIGTGPDTVRVTVVTMNVEGGTQAMRLGFDAPRHIAIDREEVRVEKNRVAGSGLSIQPPGTVGTDATPQGTR